MNRDIRDYLYFYPKSQILICEPGAEPTSHYLEGYDWYLGKAIAERANYNPAWLRILLRPISSMTLKEYNELEEINEDETILEVRNKDFELDFNTSTATTVKRLLEMGFDIFGLIEAGIAIDKTKLP